jgi:hypothetical protein
VHEIIAEGLRKQKELMQKNTSKSPKQAHNDDF